jgi:hypothetical protein
MLLETARNYVKEQTFNDPDIACVFLIGSLLEEDPFLGEGTDIDLVFIHNTEPALAREVQSLGDDFNWIFCIILDAFSTNPKNCVRILAGLSFLRWSVCVVMILTITMISYVPGSFPTFSLHQCIRSLTIFLCPARNRWVELQHQIDEFSADTVYDYLTTLYDAGNCINCLVGKNVERKEISFRFGSLHNISGPSGAGKRHAGSVRDQ